MRLITTSAYTKRVDSAPSFKLNHFSGFVPSRVFCPKLSQSPQPNSILIITSLMDAFERGHPRALVLRGFSCFAFRTRIESAHRTGAAVADHLAPGRALFLLLTSLPFRPKTPPPRISCKANYLANFPSFVDWLRGIAVCECTVAGSFPLYFLAEMTGHDGP